jgi:hypothetical protein
MPQRSQRFKKKTNRSWKEIRSNSLRFSPSIHTVLCANFFGIRHEDRVVAGGRVELPTPAFSGPRSTGELPRHGGSQRFYGRATGVSMF